MFSNVNWLVVASNCVFDVGDSFDEYGALFHLVRTELFHYRPENSSLSVIRRFTISLLGCSTASSDMSFAMGVVFECLKKNKKSINQILIKKWNRRLMFIPWGILCICKASILGGFSCDGGCYHAAKKSANRKNDNYRHLESFKYFTLYSKRPWDRWRIWTSFLRCA